MAEEVKVRVSSISMTNSKAQGKGGSLGESKGGTIAINPSTANTVAITEGAG